MANLLVMLALAGVLLSVSALRDPYPHMAAYTASFVASEVSMWQRQQLGKSAVRDLAAAAWVLLNPSWGGGSAPSPQNITTAVGMLETVFSRQLPSGQWPWHFSDETCLDPNAVQFTSLPILRLIISLGHLLPPGWVAGKMHQLELAASASYAEGIPGAEAQSFYTNIATMRLVNLHLFAQVTGNATTRAQAYKALADWTSLVTAAGLHEYYSPTYTAVTMHNLWAGASAVADQQVAAALRQYAAFVLAHCAATYWAPAAEMAGAHSRDYDFIFGDEGITWVYALSNLTAAAGVDGDQYVLFEDPITMAELYTLAGRGEVPVPSQIALELAPLVSSGKWRVSQASFSTIPGQVTSTNGSDTYLYMNAAATLGVSSLFYGLQDKQIVAQLALSRRGVAPKYSPRLAQISVVQDGWDAPYGRILTGTRGGQDVGKPTHFHATVASVQDLGLALSIQDLSITIESTAKQGPFDSIATNVVFPAGPGVDGIYVDGQPVLNISAGAPSVPVKIGATVAVHSNGGVVAFRIPFVDALAGYQPTSALKFDGPSDTDAARLVVYLYQGRNITFGSPPPPSRSIVVMGVGSAATSAEAVSFSEMFAALRVLNNASEPANWRVTVQPPTAAQLDAPPQGLPPGFASTLSAAISVPYSKTILARQVNSTAMHMPAPGVLELRWSDGRRQDITPSDFLD